MKILVIGSGAREHALCYLISKSSLVSSIYAIPGNYGISQLAQCEQIDQTDFEKIYDFCKSKMIELIIVGPEVPLVAGIVDFFREKEIKIFGPDKYASQLEGSKGFMKDLCKQNRIPTADYARFDNKEEAINYLNAQPLPIVIKADGLAAGKGVTVADTKKMAEQAINDIFDEKFGANMDVVIEEFMDGEEASYFVCCDGEDFVSLESAQDHKRIGENDTGPNTGGMGAYSPAPIFTPRIKEQVDREIITPTLKALKKNGHPYKGILYAGLMIKDGYARLVEYNIRFGDPECQVLMLRMKNDLIKLILDCLEGSLSKTKLEWEDDNSATVVVAAKGYPGDYKKNTKIIGYENFESNDLFQVFHAGTKHDGNNLLANGGRVLSVTAKNKNLRDALNMIYAYIDQLDWPDGYYRRDIGKKAIK